MKEGKPEEVTKQLQNRLLNNQLTDFSLTPTDGQGRLVANRVEPGKRPRSAMSPTLVFDQDTGKLLMTGGSPGGAIIIHYTAKLLLGTLHWQLNTQEAINLPNLRESIEPTRAHADVVVVKGPDHEVVEVVEAGRR